MARFLLVHGASHGAWCWARLIPELARLGHEARAIDLPGHGDDPTPRASVTMSDYTEAVLGALVPETILVGHSLGGLPVTLAAARAPKKVRALVYLCAAVPLPGRSFRDIRPGLIDPALDAAQEVDRAAGVTRPLPEPSGPLFYSDCSAADRAWALDRVTPQPIAALTERIDFTPPDVPRHYIVCRADRVIRPAYQEAAAAGCDHAYELPSGHSPFLSDPAGLAAILDRIATVAAPTRPTD